MLFLASYPFWVVARWGIGFPVLSGAWSFEQWQQKVLNPPVKACLLSLPAAFVCQQRSALESFGLTFAALEPAITAVDYAGRCSVPLLLAALGAKVDGIWSDLRAEGAGPKEAKLPTYQTLLIPPPAPGSTAPGQMEAAAPIQVEEQGVMPLRGHIAVLVLRQLCGALLGLAIASLLRTFCGVTDRVLLMTLLLQSCGPPMINLSVMAGVSGSVQKDSAKLLLITYAASVVTWVLWTMIFLSWL